MRTRVAYFPNIFYAVALLLDVKYVTDSTTGSPAHKHFLYFLLVCDCVTELFHTYLGDKNHIALSLTLDIRTMSLCLGDKNHIALSLTLDIRTISLCLGYKNHIALSLTLDTRTISLCLGYKNHIALPLTLVIRTISLCLGYKNHITLPWI